MVGHGDFVVGIVPNNAVRVGQAGLRAANAAHGRRDVLRVALEKDDGLLQLDRDGNLIVRSAHGDSPGLVGNGKDAGGRGITLRIVGQHDHGVFDIVVDRENLFSFRVHQNAGDKSDVGAWSKYLAPRSGDPALSRIFRPCIAQKTLPVDVGHGHHVVDRIDGKAVEHGVRVGNLAKRNDVAAERRGKMILSESAKDGSLG